MKTSVMVSLPNHLTDSAMQCSYEKAMQRDASSRQHDMEFQGAASLYCAAQHNAVTGAGSEMPPPVSMTWSFKEQHRCPA
jgi:hypothetical protein